MSIKKIDGFNKKIIMSSLKKMKNCPCKLLMVIEFIFSPAVKKLVNELDSKFDSKKGRPAYPRLLILGILLYCFSLGLDNLIDVERECCKNIYLKVFTCGIEPKVNTFRRVLENSDNLVIKKIFIITLVYLNDLRFLNFGKCFLDGTDALVNGSKYFKMTLDELEILKLMKKWGAIHNNTKPGISRSKTILECWHKLWDLKYCSFYSFFNLIFLNFIHL